MNSQGSGGIYSRFRERLRKIRLSRSKKKKQQEEFIDNKVKEIKREVNKDNTVYKRKVVGIGEKKTINKRETIKIQDKVNVSIYPKKRVGIGEEKFFDKAIDKKDIIGKKDIINRQDIKETQGLKKEQDVSQKDGEIKDNIITKGWSAKAKGNDIEEKRQYVKNNKIRIPKRKLGTVKGVENKVLRENEQLDKEKELIKNMGAEIIEKIKSSFEDKIDELEVLESELYVLSTLNQDEVQLKKVKELKEKINDLIKEVNEIMEQYNLYKKNYYIENIVWVNDNVLVDDIINYRRLIDSLDSEKKFVKEYKALEEFNRLHSSLEEVKKETEKLRSENEQRIEECNIRDKKYDNIRLEMVNANDMNKKVNEEITKQSKYFKDLMSKVNKIDKEEYVTTRMKGIGNLIGQSFRYMGLMMLSPLAGLVPSIAIKTLATRKMIHNIYNHLQPEEIKHIHYSAINYNDELNHHLTDVNYTEDLLENTLGDVKRLKEDFMAIYNSSIPGYDNTLKNIENIEKIIIHNQNKIDMVKRNLKRSKKLNEDKLKLVKELNNNS